MCVLTAGRACVGDNAPQIAVRTIHVWRHRFPCPPQKGPQERGARQFLHNVTDAKRKDREKRKSNSREGAAQKLPQEAVVRGGHSAQGLRLFLCGYAFSRAWGFQKRKFCWFLFLLHWVT